MSDGTAGPRRTDQDPVVALWRGRANQQARRADRLADALHKIEALASEHESRAFELENDDRLLCEELDCDKCGWPEDGFVVIDDEEAGRLSFCPEHWEATS